MAGPDKTVLKTSTIVLEQLASMVPPAMTELDLFTVNAPLEKQVFYAIWMMLVPVILVMQEPCVILALLTGLTSVLAQTDSRVPTAQKMSMNATKGFLVSMVGIASIFLDHSVAIAPKGSQVPDAKSTLMNAIPILVRMKGLAWTKEEGFAAFVCQVMLEYFVK